MRKKEQVSLLNKLYADLVYFENECGKHTNGELLYLKNAQNSVEVCLKSKLGKKRKARSAV